MIRTKTPAEKSARTRRLKSRNATWAQFPTATPAKVEPDILWTKDHRMICQYTPKGKELYQLITRFMAIRDGWICCICGLHMEPDEITFEHVDKRGGGRRNDQPEYWKDGVLIKNGAAHGKCNAELGSKRVTYLPHATQKK